MIIERFGMRPLPWWRGLFVAWTIFAGYLVVPYVMPASWWFSVDDVFVHDAPENATPRMSIERTIRRPFVARWSVSVKREQEDGFTFVCGGSGKNDYHPDTPLPLLLTLDWWTWPTQCRLTPGRYRVDTVWILDLPGAAEKTVRARSNVFTVKPAV